MAPLLDDSVVRQLEHQSSLATTLNFPFLHIAALGSLNLYASAADSFSGSERDTALLPHRSSPPMVTGWQRWPSWTRSITRQHLSRFRSWRIWPRSSWTSWNCGSRPVSYTHLTL